jgi:hypothetical protein
MTTIIHSGQGSHQGWRYFGTGLLGIEPVGASSTIGVKRLPTDSIGTFVLTLTGLVVGSAIRVETQAGALIEYRVAASSTEAFNAPAYSPGDAQNDLRIKVRKGTAAPFYIPYETLATAAVGAQSIFVSQIPD